jgi:flagellar biosynthesis protein FliP
MRRLLKLITGADPKDLRQAAIISVLAGLVTVLGPAVATAQSAINVDLGTGAGLSERVVQMVGLLTVLSLAPSIVIMTTSFVRIVVVLSLLRTAIGVQQSPPNPVIISLALFLTAIVMGPTFEKSYDDGIKPLLDKQIEMPEAFDAAAAPVKCSCCARSTRTTWPCSSACRRSRSPDRRRHAAEGGDAGLHDLGAEARLRDRLPAVHPRSWSSTSWSPAC